MSGSGCRFVTVSAHFVHSVTMVTYVTTHNSSINPELTVK